MALFVADVGGTNIRLAMVGEDSSLSQVKKYLCADYPDISDVIEQYFSEVGERAEQGCIGIACPVDQDQIAMTNHSWSFSVEETKAKLGLSALYMLNDFSAIAMAIPGLSNDEKVKIGSGEPQLDRPIAVYGAGTGLGVAHLVNVDGNWYPLAGEGGHVDFAPNDELDMAILQFMRKEHSRVSAERLLSGPGIVSIYRAVADYRNSEATLTSPAEISERAFNDSCSICVEAMAKFCGLMGSFAGNLALNLGTFGGVYIAGGVVPRFIQYFAESSFRQQFEAKGRFNKYLAKIPTYVVTEAEPGLMGAARYLIQKQKV